MGDKHIRTARDAPLCLSSLNPSITKPHTVSTWDRVKITESTLRHYKTHSYTVLETFELLLTLYLKDLTGANSKSMVYYGYLSKKYWAKRQILEILDATPKHTSCIHNCPKWKILSFILELT